MPGAGNWPLQQQDIHRCQKLIYALPLRSPASYLSGGKTYTATADAVIVDVDPDHAAELIKAGCIATEPFSRSLPRYVRPKETPAPPTTVRLKGQPHASYQPVTGTRYVCDAQGFFDAAVDHVKALLRAGCTRA
jgi:hypothetical protein